MLTCAPWRPRVKDLRSELENLISINNDLREERLQKEGEQQTNADTKSILSTSMTRSIFSESKNASFLNQELIMFIDNLHQKAAESGLKEDALIPQDSKKDRKIYKTLRQTMSRP